MTPAEKVLERLSNVRRESARQWMARCPAHDDDSPSMAVSEAKDGRILLHCFAGCPTHEILGALGLEVGDLFADALGHYKPGRRRRYRNPWDVINEAAHELTVIILADSALKRGLVLDDDERAAAVRALNKLSQFRDNPEAI